MKKAFKLEALDTRLQAIRFAENCGMPNIIGDAIQATDEAGELKFVPVAKLRSDQLWAANRIKERGILVTQLKEEASG